MVLAITNLMKIIIGLVVIVAVVLGANSIKDYASDSFAGVSFERENIESMSGFTEGEKEPVVESESESLEESVDDSESDVGENIPTASETYSPPPDLYSLSGLPMQQHISMISLNEMQNNKDHFIQDVVVDGKKTGIWIPRKALSEGEYPLIILFNGIHCSGSCFLTKYKVFQSISGLIDSGEIQPVIIVHPQQYATGSSTLYVGFNLEKYLASLKEKLPPEIKINSVSLVGYSGAFCSHGNGIPNALETYNDKVYLVGLADTCYTPRLAFYIEKNLKGLKFASVDNRKSWPGSPGVRNIQGFQDKLKLTEDFDPVYAGNFNYCKKHPEEEWSMCVKTSITHGGAPKETMKLILLEYFKQGAIFKI